MSFELFDEGQQDELIARLYRLTRTDRLKWNRMAISGHDFIAQAKNFSYLLRSRDRDDAPPIDLRIYDERQEPPAQMAAVSTDAFSSLNDPLYDLYQMVKRKVFGWDSAATDIFDELDELEDKPPWEK